MGCCCQRQRDIEMVMFVNADSEKDLCDDIRASQLFQDGISTQDFSMEIADTYGVLKSPITRQRIATAFTDESSDVRAYIEECYKPPSSPRTRFGNIKWQLIIRRGTSMAGVDPDAERVTRICDFVKSCAGYKSWLKFELRLDSSTYGDLEMEHIRRKVEATLTTSDDKCTIEPIRQTLEEAEMESTGKWALTIERSCENM